jgi:hypothetical protein
VEQRTLIMTVLAFTRLIRVNRRRKGIDAPTRKCLTLIYYPACRRKLRNVPENYDKGGASLQGPGLLVVGEGVNLGNEIEKSLWSC